VADASGVVFLPSERADEAFALAAELRGREDKRLRAITEGADPRTVLGTDETVKQR
jgi:regulator of RNase E activity RraA